MPRKRTNRYDHAGRPAYVPTAELKRQVTELKSCGLTNKSIAKCIGIDDATLTKYYRYELDTAAAHMVRNVVSRLVQHAERKDMRYAMISVAACKTLLALMERTGVLEKSENVTEINNNVLVLDATALTEKLTAAVEQRTQPPAITIQ